MPSQAANQITEGVIWKQLLRFFFPILLGTFFQQLYNTVDTVIVGRFVGTQALAAVGSTAALVNLLNGFFICDTISNKKNFAVRFNRYLLVFRFVIKVLTDKIIITHCHSSPFLGEPI